MSVKEVGKTLAIVEVLVGSADQQQELAGQVLDEAQVQQPWKAWNQRWEVDRQNYLQFLI